MSVEKGPKVVWGHLGKICVFSCFFDILAEGSKGVKIGVYIGPCILGVFHVFYRFIVFL